MMKVCCQYMTKILQMYVNTNHLVELMKIQANISKKLHGKLDWIGNTRLTKHLVLKGHIYD